jgi:hypothetical protein
MADAQTQPQNEGQATITDPGGVGTVDTGTGAYDNPPTEVTYGSEYDPNPTGAVEGPPAETTVTSPAGDEFSAPTGAAPNPPAEVTQYEWPATAPADQTTTQTDTTQPADTKAVESGEAGVENK